MDFGFNLEMIYIIINYSGLENEKKTTIGKIKTNTGLVRMNYILDIF